MRFQLDSVSTAFSNRCVFDENAECFRVKGWSTRIEIKSFFKRKTVVWKGPHFSKMLNSCFNDIGFSGVRLSEVLIKNFEVIFVNQDQLILKC